MASLFCSACGKEHSDKARFCKNCGCGLSRAETVNEYENANNCPNCGSPINSLATSCIYCGHEARGVKAAHSVKELVEKLELIEARQMPLSDNKKSIMKTLIGRDFKDEEKEEEARENFLKQKNKEKAAVIINFPIPNTKEDIMEFMLLIAVNIDEMKDFKIDKMKDCKSVVEKAWITKLEQVYKKAEIVVNNSLDLEQVKSLYIEKKKAIRLKQIKGNLLIPGFIILYLALMGMLWDPIITGIILIGLVILGLYIFKHVKDKWHL